MREVLDRAGVQFYMYTADRFTAYATQYLNREVQAALSKKCAS